MARKAGKEIGRDLLAVSGKHIQDQVGFSEEKGGIPGFNHPEQIIEPLQLEDETLFAGPGTVPDSAPVQDPAATLALPEA
jgi:hypothetical protein